jgi:hypothetical protein
MEDGGWRMEDGGWRMEDGGWRMEDGGWRMEDGGWGCGMKDGLQWTWLLLLLLFFLLNFLLHKFSFLSLEPRKPAA